MDVCDHNLDEGDDDGLLSGWEGIPLNVDLPYTRFEVEHTSYNISYGV